MTKSRVDKKVVKSVQTSKLTKQSKVDIIQLTKEISTSKPIGNVLSLTSRKPISDSMQKTVISLPKLNHINGRSCKNSDTTNSTKMTVNIPMTKHMTKKPPAIVTKVPVTISSKKTTILLDGIKPKSKTPSLISKLISKTTSITSAPKRKAITKTTAKTVNHITKSTTQRLSSLSKPSKSSSVQKAIKKPVSKNGTKTTITVKTTTNIPLTAAAMNQHALLLAKLRKNKTKQDLTSLVASIKNDEIKKAKQALLQQKQLEKQLLFQKKKKLKSKLAKRNKNLKRKRSRILPPEIKKIKRIKKIWEEKDWEGYSDDEGSVDSGVLDENICFECGMNTHREIEWESLILCDTCDAEYHMKCVGLDLHPRHQFTCPRCLMESKHFQTLDFTIDSIRFPTPVIKKVKRGEAPVEVPGICYSPSRPLELAWPECVDKGFMVVSRLFSYDVMRILTHGTLERVTLSGRVAETWPGATTLFAQKAQALTATNVINRGGRYDIKIPDFVIDSLQLELILQPVLDKLRSIMGTPTPQLRTHNIVFVPVNSDPQAWHCDDTITRSKSSLFRYFTILIHLNPIDAMCGGTELWVKSLKRGDMVRGRPGDAFVFDGSLLHRGQANLGHVHRLFYYASFACRNDTNNDER